MMTKVLATLSLILAAPAAQATVFTTTSASAPVTASGTVTAVKLAGITTPSRTTISTPGYTVSLADVASGQGVVNGTSSGAYAAPVAGVSNGARTYLTGDYGSGTTTDLAASGNYLSTGASDILISFASVQTSLSLLWGSIDSYNTLTFLDDLGQTLDTLTGSAVLAMAQNTGTGNSIPGKGVSTYVTATESAGFSAVRFATTTPSFEFAAVAASTGTFAVPEPATLSVFGVGLVMAAAAKRRRRAA